MTTREEILRRAVLVPCDSKEALGRWIRLYLDVDLPDCVVDPDSNSSPLDMIWELYDLIRKGGDPERSEFFYYAARAAFKSLSFAILQTLVLLHLDSDCVHVAAIELQAQKVASYIKINLERPYLRECKVPPYNLREIHVASYRRDGTDPVTAGAFKELEGDRDAYVKTEHYNMIIPATVRACNGQHALTVCVSGETLIDVEGTSRGRRKMTARALFRLAEGRDAGGRSGGEDACVVDEVPPGVPQVLSLNQQTGRLELVPVVRAQRSWQDTLRIITPGTHRLQRTGESSGRLRSARRADGRRELVVSLSHPVLVVGNGFVQASEVRPGDRVVVLGKSPTGRARLPKLVTANLVGAPMAEADDSWDQVVLGSLLGDAAVYWKGDSNPWMVEQHCKEQGAYMAWKRQVISERLRTSDRKAVSGYTGEPMVGYYVHASTLLRRYRYVRSFLQGLERLGPLGLAVWYMDDGCAGNGFRLSTEGFTRDQNRRLAEFLGIRFGIQVEVGSYERDGKIYDYLHGPVEAKRRLVEVCGQHVHPDMAYKFDLSANVGRCKFCAGQFWYYERGGGAETCGSLACELIQQGLLLPEVVQEVEPAGSRWVYDFTLARNYTFFTNSVLSHNCVDEVEVVQEAQALREIKLIPAEYKGRRSVTAYTSSRKFAVGHAQNMIDEAPKTGLQLRHWNVIDITERCPPERHRPDLPKERVFRSDELLKVVRHDQYARLEPNLQKQYVEAEVFAGCADCALYPACRGSLVNQRSSSKLLRSIPDTIQQFRKSDVVTAQSQLLCRKPSTEGLIYPQLDGGRHRVSAVDMIEMVTGDRPAKGWANYQEVCQVLTKAGAQWFVGMDFGYTDPWAAVLAARFGERMFVVYACEVPGLDSSQQVAMAEEHLLPFAPRVYADVTDKQSVIAFRKAHFKMVDWKKTPGSIKGGISTVRRKIDPFGADPQIYFLAGEDGVERLFQHLAKYSWKVDASGKATDVPNETDDHLPDAFRYMVMNVFAKNQAGISTGDHQLALPAQAAVQPHPEQQVARPAAWMQDLVAQWNANNDPEATADQPVQKAGGLKWSI